MVSRSFQDSQCRHRFGRECVVSLYELEEAIGKNSEYVVRHLDILGRRGLVSEVYEDENNMNCQYCELCGDSSGWAYWNDIREYCMKENIPLKRVCVDLDFLYLVSDDD